MPRRRRTFARASDGTLEVTLARGELDLLAELGTSLAELLEHPSSDDPAIVRLFPRAYLDPTEEAAEQEWQALEGSDLLRQRLDALGGLVAAARSSRTTPDHEHTGLEDRVTLALESDDEVAWLGVLNDLRLLLGTRLDVSDEPGAAQLPTTGPLASLAELYAWLSYLQEELVELLLSETPPDESPPGVS